MKSGDFPVEADVYNACSNPIAPDACSVRLLKSASDLCSAMLVDLALGEYEALRMTRRRERRRAVYANSHALKALLHMSRRRLQVTYSPLQYRFTYQSTHGETWFSQCRCYYKRNRSSCTA